jgi:predicted phage terminase large subunit-like protein
LPTRPAQIIQAPADRLAYLRQLLDERDRRAATQLSHGNRPWRKLARPKQLPPDDPCHHLPDGNGYSCGCETVDDAYHVFLILSGRGFGKSWIGSNWVIEQALATPDSEWAVIAPTFRDVKKTCFEGSTGLLAALQPGELRDYNKSGLELTIASGARIFGYSADQPERLRGSNLYGAWCDELGSWRYPAAWYEALMPALRIGQHPRVVVTTTPRPTALIRDLVSRNDGSVHITRGSTWENAANLSQAALTELRRRYEGTRLGAQELEGRLLDDIEGALWSSADIEHTRVTPATVPDLVRVVVAIDPAVTSGEDSDETGIIVAGEGRDSHGYVLADLTMRGTPDACMRTAVQAYREHEADCVVAEVNNGGDFVASLLRTVDPMVPYRAVRATRGKRTRAEPVSALYEQHRIHHVGVFADLEDQMVSWTPDSGESPDRVDALVWAFTELKGIAAGSWLSAYGTVRCESCEQAFVSAGRTECPWCRTPVPSGDDDTTERPALRLIPGEAA